MRRAADAARAAWRSGAPHVRGAFVLFHVVAVLALASPAVQGAAMNKKTWQQPAVQAELSAWSDRLRAVGLTATNAEIEDGLWTLAQGWMALRAAVTAPFRPYARYAGAGQAWQLFVAPQVYTSTLIVELEIDGAWRPVFIDNDPRHQWRARALEQDRVQSLTFWFGFQRRANDWRTFAAWIARAAAVDFPSATRARISMERGKTPSPDEARRGVVHPTKRDKQLVVAVPRSER